jgi:hypothetical protein
MVVTTIHRWSPPQRWAPRSRTTTHDHRRGMISPISKPTRQTVWWFRYLSVVTAGLLRWNGAAQPPPHTTPPRQPPHVSAGQTLVFWCTDRPICAVSKILRLGDFVAVSRVSGVSLPACVVSGGFDVVWRGRARFRKLRGAGRGLYPSMSLMKRATPSPRVGREPDGAACPGF